MGLRGSGLDICANLIENQPFTLMFCVVTAVFRDLGWRWHMHELLTQLSGLDAGAEAAVRIISSYDTLIDRRVPFGALTRATAALAQCAAGISRPHHPVVRFGPDGKQLDGVYPEVSRTLRWGEGLSVWLERSGPPWDLDDLILERFAMAARILMPGPPPAAQDLADPALIEILISDSQCAEDRARAARLLGLDPSRSIRVVAVATTDAQDAATAAVGLVAAFRPTTTRAAAIGSIAAVVIPPTRSGSATDSGLRTTSNIVAGVGGSVLPHRARQSWLQGQVALRFAVADTAYAIVHHDDLGALTLLADIPSDRLAANPDVRTLATHAETDSGRMDLAAVAALCRTGSLRRAAVALHMHHSTVAARVARAEQKVGLDLGSPEGMLRTSIALHALRLLDSPAVYHRDEPAQPPCVSDTADNPDSRRSRHYDSFVEDGAEPHR